VGASEHLWIVGFQEVREVVSRLFRVYMEYLDDISLSDGTPL